jgi:hypothetical protein
MLEKIRQVNNPLTIIAVFAGIAEISGTAILPFLDREVQHIYVWFLIVFPLLLVVLFFATLNFNHKVLTLRQITAAMKAFSGRSGR